MSLCSGSVFITDVQVTLLQAALVLPWVLWNCWTQSAHVLDRWWDSVQWVCSHRTHWVHHPGLERTAAGTSSDPVGWCSGYNLMGNSRYYPLGKAEYSRGSFWSPSQGGNTVNKITICVYLVWVAPFWIVYYLYFRHLFLLILEGEGKGER